MILPFLPLWPITHHITSHHITSHHITSHHITSHHITSHVAGSQKFFFGNGADFVKSVANHRHNWFLKEAHETYGPLVAYTVNGGMFVGLCDHEVARRIHEKVGGDGVGAYDCAFLY